MKFLDLRTKEEQLNAVLSDIPIKRIWLIITLIWSLLGIYFYNEWMPIRNWFTELTFYAITILIVWQNKDAVLYFFRNPFKYIDMPYVYSSVLWVIPFTILMSTVPLVLIPQAFGWISADTQNISEMSFTFREYISNVIMLPLGVIVEEAVNLLLLVAVSKFLSKRVKSRWLILVVVLTSIFFGFLHVTAWGMESAISRMLIHIPFLFSVLYFRNVWPCIFAHMYQNWLSYTSVIVTDFATLFVTYGLLLLLVIFVYRHFVSHFFKLSRKSE